jgi:hypothetical protein|nr:MAG TPA: hemolysin XhlA [Crassvirales sp.]
MNDKSKTTFKWVVGLVIAILTAVMTYINTGCVSSSTYRSRGVHCDTVSIEVHTRSRNYLP